MRRRHITGCLGVPGAHVTLPEVHHTQCLLSSFSILVKHASSPLPPSSPPPPPLPSRHRNREPIHQFLFPISWRNHHHRFTTTTTTSVSLPLRHRYHFTTIAIVSPHLRQYHDHYHHRYKFATMTITPYDDFQCHWPLNYFPLTTATLLPLPLPLPSLSSQSAFWPPLSTPHLHHHYHLATFHHHMHLQSTTTTSNITTYSPSLDYHTSTLSPCTYFIFNAGISLSPQLQFLHHPYPTTPATLQSCTILLLPQLPHFLNHITSLTLQPQHHRHFTTYSTFLSHTPPPLYHNYHRITVIIYLLPL